jgi:chemotaxis protein histidine kinase CheA
MDDEILDLYFEEAFDLLSKLEKEFKSIDTNGVNEKSLEEIRRIMHTIKGSSRLIDLEDIAVLSQDAEEGLKNILAEKKDVSSDEINKYYQDFLGIKAKVNQIYNERN